MIVTWTMTTALQTNCAYQHFLIVAPLSPIASHMVFGTVEGLCFWSKAGSKRKTKNSK